MVTYPRLLTALMLLGALGTACPAATSGEMRQRVQRVKRATVRIFVNGNASGSGFLVAPTLVATCFHVVQHAAPGPNNTTQVTYATNIEVEFHDGHRVAATPHSSVSGSNLPNALGRDVTLLQIPSTNISPLKLGTFAHGVEGAPIYLAGYPFGIAQPVVATGIISTKWSNTGYLNQGGPRDVAWLDITMNKGNSGGPVLLIADNPADDEVIGIANFNLNPFTGPAEQLIHLATTFPGGAAIMGINFGQFAALVGQAMESNSLGVGGCVSIDYVHVPHP